MQHIDLGFFPNSCGITAAIRPNMLDTMSKRRLYNNKTCYSYNLQLIYTFEYNTLYDKKIKPCCVRKVVFHTAGPAKRPGYCLRKFKFSSTLPQAQSRRAGSGVSHERLGRRQAARGRRRPAPPSCQCQCAWHCASP